MSFSNATPSFQMPKVKLGQIVYWHADGDEGRRPVMAFVTELGERGITLAIIRPGNYNIDPVHGVPHVDDPRVQQLLDTEAGCWQHMTEWEAKHLTPASAPKKEAVKT